MRKNDSLYKIVYKYYIDVGGQKPQTMIPTNCFAQYTPTSAIHSDQC